MTMLDAVFVGINVSKGTLDVALRPSGESFRVSNDQGGIRALVERLSGVQPSWLYWRQGSSLRCP
jgi:transposase